MEENNNEEEQKYLSPDEYVEKFKESRRLLRAKIKQFMEEETGETYQMEDDLFAILKSFTPVQQQNVAGRITLLQKFPNQQ